MPEAHNAPRSGAPWWRQALLVVLLILVAVSVYDWLQKRGRASANPEAPAPEAWQVAATEQAARTRQQAEDDRREAEGAVRMAKVFVERALIAPGSARFICPGGDWSTCATRLAPGRYLVRGEVDSQNRFGALLRSEWGVTVEHTNGTEWVMLGSPIIQER